MRIFFRKNFKPQISISRCDMKVPMFLYGLLIFIFLSFLFTPIGYAQSLEKITIGLPAYNITSIAFRIAQVKGMFRNEGLEAELIAIRSSISLVALINNQLDYTSIMSNSMVSAALGLPIRALMLTVKSSDHALVGKKEIRSVSDLRGKAVSFTLGGATESIVDAMLAKGKLSMKDIVVQPIAGSSNRYAALIGGRSDAALLDIVWTVKAEASGFKRLIAAADVYDGAFSGVTATVDKIKNNPDQIKRVIRALLNAQSFVVANKSETVKVMSDWVKLDPSTAAEAYDLYIRASNERNGLISDQTVKLELDIARKRMKKLRKDVSPGDIVDLRILKEVLKEMNR